jgi:hypothetical protein
VEDGQSSRGRAHAARHRRAGRARYLSNWNDGLVILDIGKGVAGGSPSSPQLVSQYKYDLNDMYRQVEAVGGPGFIRGTHTAWRHDKLRLHRRRGVSLLGREGSEGCVRVPRVRPDAGHRRERPEASRSRWRSTSRNYGGVHNIWVAGDTLYMGAYNAGFRAFDISGELKGDLRAQQREMVHVNTADMEGKSKNTAMTWGVVVRDRPRLRERHEQRALGCEDGASARGAENR